MLAQMPKRDGGFHWGCSEGNQARGLEMPGIMGRQWTRRHLEEKEFRRLGFPFFMALSKLRPQRGEHHSVEQTGGIGSVWGFGGPAMVLGMALDLKELPSRGGDEWAHRCSSLERCCPGQWGREEGEQELRMLASGPSFYSCLNYLFAAWKHFLPRDSYTETPMDTESMQQSGLDSSGCEPSYVLWATFSFGRQDGQGRWFLKFLLAVTISSLGLRIMNFTHIVFTTHQESGKAYNTWSLQFCWGKCLTRMGHIAGE